MKVRILGTVIGAIATGIIVVACASKEPTSPSAVGAKTLSAAAAACSPDVTAPVINSQSASPNVLWPPNHKFVPVTISWNVTDDCSTPVCAISSISSNEPVNWLGDGNTEPDWMITSSSTALIRAERSGLGGGRVYTISSTCHDAAGNVATSSATVTVPHDQGSRQSS